MNKPEDFEWRSHFVRETGLYQPFTPPDGMSLTAVIAGLFRVDHTINCYCVACGENSIFVHTYRHDGLTDYQFATSIENKIRMIQYTCQHVHCQNPLSIYVLARKSALVKVGQYPSIADMQLGDLAKYKRSLISPYDSYLSKAIGLYAHGIGIGSYVYLRRIFEQLILEEYGNATAAGEDVPADFLRLRMEDKIGALRHRLPSFLVENRNIYSYLSIGIHELDEGICQRFFPILKDGIIHILEERQASIDAERRRRESQRALQSIAEMISNERSAGDREGHVAPGTESPRKIP